MSIFVRTHRFKHRNHDGYAIVAILGVLALVALLLISMLHGTRIERTTSSSAAASAQSYLIAESGTAAASALLIQASSNRPAFLTGLAGGKSKLDIAPCVILGNTNLTNRTQLLPLFSHELAETAAYPKLSEGVIDTLFEKRLSTNLDETIDLNDPLLMGHSSGDSNLLSGGMVASTGHYPALWEKVRNSEGKVIGRYAFILTDETARLNPLLHQGNPRTNPVDWDMGPGDLPLTNGTTILFTTNQVERLHRIAATLPSVSSFEAAFGNPQTYNEKRSLLTRDPCRVPDLIPAGLPEGGLPKYNLNDLATNPAWGSTHYARAEKIAAIIDKNLPKFKQRDPSLAGRSYDQTLYLRRLACNIVDYISADQGPTCSPDGDAVGRTLVPLVTQIAERCTRTSLTSNSTTIESRFFAEVWNPTTSTIPAGGIPRLIISNRATLKFGNGIRLPFDPYDKTAAPLPALRPNEFFVIAFEPASQTWTSPTATTNPPSWESGPDGNADGLHHQSFAFGLNGRLIDRTRPPKDPGSALAGGMNHLAQTLSDSRPHWQINTIPTWSTTSDKEKDPDSADEAIQPGNYRFVGDPNATYLSYYKWGVATNYPAKTLWNGISPAGVSGSGCLMDPAATWTRRDRVPTDPVRGNSPFSDTQTPDLILSSYRPDREGSLAPFVIRKSPMLSLGELGHICDPAQVDDQLQAPSAGVPSSTFCCGGGRTLRIGQPECSVLNPSATWDTEGKRAIELLDLFTLADKGRQPETSSTNTLSTNEGVAGRLNVNTASHPALVALFSGIAVTSDARFTNSTISATTADQLATLIENSRPFSRLSDLRVLTTNLCNAETYIPYLSRNLPGVNPPVANVFDRAREEALGKIIGHCTVQSRSYRLFVVGETLDPKGKPTGRSIMEAIIHLSPDVSGHLVPSLHDVQWH
jgi:hypothetical protein